MPSIASSPLIFPAFVGQASVTFDVDDPAPLDVQFPGIELPSSLGGAVRKRQVEFVAGRWCAREALRRCAPEHAAAPVGIGASSEPLWPPGIVGAITHTHGFASVAVARASDARGIGLDAERPMTDKLAAEIREHIASSAELDSLVRATGWSAAKTLTLVFSAKESIFKCLYPEVLTYFDFRDAMIDAIDVAESRFSARLLVTLTPRLRAGLVLEGRFAQAAGALCTSLVMPAR